MQILMQRGYINDCLEIDNISEIDMTEEQRNDYFNKIIKELPELDPYCWFNMFLQWFILTYGEYDCSDEPCECCGDYTETYKLDI